MLPRMAHEQATCNLLIMALRSGPDACLLQSNPSRALMLAVATPGGPSATANMGTWCPDMPAQDFCL